MWGEGGWWKNKKEDERSRSMLDWLRQRPKKCIMLRAGCVGLPSATPAGWQGLVGGGRLQNERGE